MIQRDTVTLTDKEGNKQEMVLPIKLDRNGKFYYIKIKKKYLSGEEIESIYMNGQKPR